MLKVLACCFRSSRREIFEKQLPLQFARVAITERLFSSLKPTGREDRRYILSIDGGGIRGIIPGKILQKIEEITQRPIAKSFDLIGGTSTGGILALALSLPSEKNSELPKYTASQVLNFYLEKQSRKQIFQKPPFPSEKNLLINPSGGQPMVAGLSYESGSFSAELLGKKVVQIESVGDDYVIKTAALQVLIPKGQFKHPSHYKIHSDFETIRQCVQPKYVAEGIESFLKKHFGTIKLSKLIPKEVLTTAFSTSTMRHHIWSKVDAKNGERHDIAAWEAARSTSAAPTFFPPFSLHGSEYVDGAISMNNPMMALVLQAEKMGIARKSLFCVSLGTGEFTKPLAPTTHFGPLHWAPSLFEATSSAQSSQTDDFMKILFGADHYVRIQVDLPKNMPLDAIDQRSVDALEEIGEMAITKNSKKLEQIFRTLT